MPSRGEGAVFILQVYESVLQLHILLKCILLFLPPFCTFCYFGAGNWTWKCTFQIASFSFFFFFNGSLVWFVIQASFKLLYPSQFNYYLLVYDSSNWRPQMSHRKNVIMWFLKKSLNSRDKRGIMTLFYIITYLNDLFKVCTFSLLQPVCSKV